MPNNRNEAQKNVRVQDLRGGDVVKQGRRHATFIGSSTHPEHSSLALVVWRLDDGNFSYDALAWEQVVGDVMPQAGRGNTWLSRVKRAVNDTVDRRRTPIWDSTEDGRTAS